MNIKKGDTVKIISGDDKGKTGKVVKAIPAINKIVVEGINVMKKHERSRKQGQKGQVVDIAMPIDVSNAVKQK
jgi:large subunit ribosomal protein L24